MTVGLWPMSWFTASYPKIWCLGILNILSSRNLRNHTWRKGFLRSSVSPEAGPKTITWEEPSLNPEGRSILCLETEGCWEESKWTGLAVSLSLPSLAHVLLSYHIFLQLSTLHQTCSGLSASFGLHLVMKAPTSHKTSIKLVCFSPLICFCQFYF